MYKFKYNEYDDCWFSVSRYSNGNICVEIWQDNHGPIVRVTTNLGVSIPDSYLAIKDYSENEGMVEFLKKLDIIADDPVMTVPIGYVFIPVHRLTNTGENILKIFAI